MLIALIAGGATGPLMAQEKEKTAVPTSQLIDVLQSRSDSVKTFAADIVVVSRPGEEIPALAAERRRYADWVDKQHPELAKQNADFRAGIDRMQSGPTVTYRYRYMADAKGRIRVERLSDPSEKNAPQPGVVSLRIFTGSEWKSYMESTDVETGGRTADLTIQEKDRENLSWHEIARGLGVFLSPRFRFDSLSFDLSPRSEAVQVVRWEELIRNLPGDSTHEEDSMPPGGGDAKPSLILETKPHKDTGKGVLRFQAWFDPQHAFTLCGLTANNLEPAGEGRWDHLKNYDVQWSDPAEIDSLPVFRECRVRFFEHFPTTDDSKPDKEWGHRAYHIRDFAYTFTNIRINGPLDPASFDVTPVAGTNVIDESKGYVYVVGKAGEELQKTAISERERRPAPGNEGSHVFHWRKVFIIANVTFLIALIIYWIVFRKRKPGP
ncbi:MAG: hypothetical protein AB7O26_02445 [Planctomycetaceae bacterium]